MDSSSRSSKGEGAAGGVGALPIGGKKLVDLLGGFLCRVDGGGGACAHKMLYSGFAKEQGLESVRFFFFQFSKVSALASLLYSLTLVLTFDF